MAEHEQGHHVQHAVHGARGGLTRKVGPLPVWAWASIAGVGIGAFIYLHRGSSTPTTSAASPATDSGQVADGSVSGGTGAPGSPLPSDSAGDTSTPAAPAAGYPDIGQEIQDVVSLVDALQGGGLLNIGTDGATPPGGQAANGASTATATAHPAAAKSTVKVNAQKDNPRKGKDYKTVKLANGRTAHVYTIGGKKTIVLPGTTSTKDASHRDPVAHAPAAATKVNADPGSPRQGESYRTLTSGGWIVHRYGSGKTYHDVRIRKA